MMISGNSIRNRKSRKYWLGLGIFLIFILVIGVFFYPRKSTSFEVDYKVFNNEKGEWCYDVYVNNSLFIRQSYLPAVQGNIAIKDKDVATKLAESVVSKIERGENPAVTVSEMREMDIISK